jgi:hypothetical protein
VVKNEIRKNIRISLVKETQDKLILMARRWKYEVSKDGKARHNYNGKKLCKTSKEEKSLKKMVFKEGEFQMSRKHGPIRSKQEKITANSEARTWHYDQKCWRSMCLPWRN